MADLIEFLKFQDHTVRIVTVGIVFLSMSAAIAGSFAFLRKRALVGDAIAHAILPGIAVAFIIGQTKDPLILLLGALISGWLAILAIDYISQQTKISGDSSIAIVLSVFFGVGILLLTYIQHSGSGNQSGLDQFLFGSAASMRENDLLVYCGVAVLLILVVTTLYKELMLISFNEDYARILGLPVKALRLTLNTVTVLAIAIGIQSVGVVLMAALLITPAATARSWTDNLRWMILFSALFGGLSGLIGSYASYTAPQMPTGPWVVMSLSAFALLSIFFAPRRGILSRIARQRQNRRKIITENLLKAFYALGEKRRKLQQPVEMEDLRQQRDFTTSELYLGLRKLLRGHMLLRRGNYYYLTRKGVDEARRIVRLHRLWEMYLTQRLRLKADHIHPNAETIEHIITPEIEQQILDELGYPETDPHDSPIPYSQS